MDWLGATALLIGLILVIFGIGLTFSIEAVQMIIDKFLGLLALLIGIILMAGGYMLVREQ